MPRWMITALVAVGAASLLSGCTAAAPEASQTPTRVPAETIVEDPVPAIIDGSWVLTRTVTESDEDSQPVGTTETRYVTFTVAECERDRCTGTLLVGATPDELTELPFSQVGDDLTYDIDGANNCVDQDGVVLLEGAYAWVQHIELTATTKDGDRATALGGYAQYDYASIEGIYTFGCPSDAGTIMYEYMGVPA